MDARRRATGVWTLIGVEMLMLCLIYISYCLTVKRRVDPKVERKAIEVLRNQKVEPVNAPRKGGDCDRSKYSKLFCDAVARWDDSMTEIVDFSPVPRTKRAIFLLVRMQYLGEFIKGSQELFNENFYDVFYVFNDENKTGSDVVEGVKLTYIDVGHFWQEYPKDFDPVNTESTWVARGDKWGYHHMITFFWKNVHRLPEVKDVKYYMRLDGDSCLSALDKSPFDSFRKDIVYIKNSLFYDHGKVVTDLAQFTKDYIDFFKIDVADPMALRTGISGSGYRVAGYYNNFEMMDIEFWLRADVQHFVNFVDVSWGIFLHRWGDAPLRYLALAMFAKPGQVISKPHRWRYAHPCRVN